MHTILLQVLTQAQIPNSKVYLTVRRQRGGPGPPLGFEFKLPKNGFSEGPQTSQVSRTSLWTNFGEKIFWSYDSPRTP